MLTEDFKSSALEVLNNVKLKIISSIKIRSLNFRYYKKWNDKKKKNH